MEIIVKELVVIQRLLVGILVLLVILGIIK